MSIQFRRLKQAIQQGGGEKKPEAYPLGYVEDFFEPTTPLGACFNRLRLAISVDHILRHNRQRSPG
jgi:hypothetical protein